MENVNISEIISPANLAEAFNNFHNPAALNSSPLTRLESIQARYQETARQSAKNSVRLGAVLAAGLKSLIQSLEPKDATLPPNHPTLHPYKIFQQTVLLGRSATDTASRLYISRSQFYRIREKTIADLCKFWLDRELEQYPTTVSTEEPPPEAALAQVEEEFIPEPEPTFRNGFRILTILAVKLSGFYRLNQQADLETAHELLTRVMTTTGKVVREAGGYVSQWSEQGLCAYFGVPVSREDDAGRAIRCALAIMAALEIMKEDLAPDLAYLKNSWPECGIGIGSGKVFAGLTQAFGGPQQYSVTGAALETANSLSEKTAPGCLLIDHITYRQVREIFGIEPLNTFQDGTPAKRVYRVWQELFQTEMFEARNLHGLEIAMIGRDPEWHMLLGQYHEVLGNNSVRHLTITGLAGSGKSRLVAEFHRYLADRPYPLNFWFGQAAQEDQLPYRPFAEMLRHAAQVKPYDNHEETRAKLHALCLQYFKNEPLSLNNPAAIRQGLTRADEVAHLLSLIVGVGWPGSPFLEALNHTSSQLTRKQTFQAFINLCERVAAPGQPLILVIEDLHWAEESSRDLWNQLSAELAEVPVLLLGLARPELYERQPDWGLGLDRHTRLDLKPLSPVRTFELIRHVLRKVENFPEQLVEKIGEAADGNPFYIEEIVKMLLDAGVVVTNETEANWRFAGQPETPELDLSRPLVPDTVEKVITARLDQLSANDRRVAELAAVIGPYFSLEALDYLLTHPANPARPVNSTLKVELQAALRHLQERELITRKANWKEPARSGQGYFFRHSVLREVVYSNLPQRLRAELHKNLAEWLVEKREGNKEGSEEARAISIAHHYELANMYSQATYYYIEAGNEACSVYALSEAIGSYKRAFATFTRQNLPPDKLAAGERSLLVDLYRKKGWAESILGHYQAALADYDAALALVAAPDWEERAKLRVGRCEVLLRQTNYVQGLEEAQLALSYTPAGVIQALLQTIIGVFYFRQGHYQQAEGITLKALRALEQSPVNEIKNIPAELFQEQQAMIAGYRNLGTIYWGRNDFAGATQFLEKALSLAYQTNSVLNVAECLYFQGLIQRDRGEISQAVRHFEQARAIFKQHEALQSWMYCHVNLGMIAWRRGELGSARECFEQGLKVAQETGSQFHLAHCLLNLGIVSRDEGELAQAAEHLEKSRQICEGIKDYRGLAYNLFFLGVVQSDRQEFDLALDCFAQSRDIREKAGNLLGKAECDSRIGRIYTEQGRFDEAKTLLEASLELFERIGTGYGLIYTYTSLGYFYMVQGEYEKAEEFLHKALDASEKNGILETKVEALVLLGRTGQLKGAASDKYFQEGLILAAGRYPHLTALVNSA